MPAVRPGLGEEGVGINASCTCKYYGNYTISPHHVVPPQSTHN